MSEQNKLYTYAIVALVIGIIVGYFANGTMSPSMQNGEEELMMQITALESEIDDYEEQVAGLQDDIDEYETAVASLQSEIDDLEAELADMSMMMGPVDGLDVPSTIPLIHGWYKGTEVTYFDFGLNPRTAIPIMVFFQEDNPDSPVMGQMNIIDAVPGQPGYSAFWRVYKVLAPNSYMANSITSLQGVLDSGFMIQETDIVVNCPVVNPETTTEMISYDLVQGWYRERMVYYFDFGANSGSMGSVVDKAPIYVFFDINGDHVDGQMNVIDVLPGDMGYSDLWHVHKVIVGFDYDANSLSSVDEIMSAVSAGDATIEETNLLVNCPIVE